jgi:hypothetical protein
MIEADVVQHFVTWLRDTGWDVTTEVDFADVVAHRDDEILVAEAKGTTTSPGLDVDTAYGQLLRRMDTWDDRAGCRYALVVPESARTAAERVHPGIRELLGIELYVIQQDGTVIPK